MNYLPVILKFHYFPAGGRRTYVLYGAGKFPEGNYWREYSRAKDRERNFARTVRTVRSFPLRVFNIRLN